MSKSKQLIQFICPRCGRELAWAAETASVYCKSCDRWIKAREIKPANPARMVPEQRQLVLF